MLGASGARVFCSIVVPHVRPALEAAFIILFLYAFGAYDIPALLSESSPGMLSITVFDLFFQRDLALRPQAMALLVAMFLFAAAFIWAYVRLAAKLSSRERKL
jgi:putative spermidine/putrescine transport system permease protein